VCVLHAIFGRRGFDDVLFQQGESCPHFHFAVRNFLDGKFPRKWIGRSGLSNLPPRFPYLTRFGFFFWGYIKILITFYYLPPLCRSFLGGYELQLHMPSKAITGLNLNTNMIRICRAIHDDLLKYL
jgi:hypothetical protein